MSDWIDRFSIEGKTALVTGASKGIGAEICSVFADAGANIIATGRDQAGLAKVKKIVESKQRTCIDKICDLASSDEINDLVSSISGQQVDILVNNAGIALIEPAISLSLDQWDRTMAINVRAPFQLAQLIAPGMIERRWGKIINISSQAAVVAFDNHAAYSASKAAMNGLTRCLMKEWAQHNIQVNAICPTVILTDMGIENWSAPEKKDPFIARTPLRRFGEPVEVADLALFLASSASELINGETLMIDGGFSAV